MKEGTGQDPFEEERSDSDEELDSEPGSIHSGSKPNPGQPREEPTTDAASQGESVESAKDASSTSPDIPYKFRRSEITAGRDRVPLFLHEETKNDEKDARIKLEDRLDEDVPKTDLREALLKAGLENLDDAERHLETWGYGMTFD